MCSGIITTSPPKSFNNIGCALLASNTTSRVISEFNAPRGGMKYDAKDHSCLTSKPENVLMALNGFKLDNDVKQSQF